jgi:hypothetical protein
MSNAIQSLWQHQEPDLKQMSTDKIRRLADQAFSEDRKHKVPVPLKTALLTAAILVGCFGIFILVNPTLIGRIAGVIVIGTGISMVYRAYRLMEDYPLLPGAFGIEAYRRILGREQKALAICWQTMMLIQVGVVLEVLSDPAPNSRRVVTALAMVTPGIVVSLLTRAKARAYGRRTRELDRL